jgi:DNA-binding LytR/AlgR family response regulator
MITCVVLDDEQYSIDVMLHHIKQTSFLKLAGTSTHPSEALNMLNEMEVDLLFCDIQMPNVSGLEIVKAINGKCRVILTTAHSEFALQGYELNVVDYLLKPVAYARFLDAVNKVNALKYNVSPVTSQKNADDFIFVKTGIKGQVRRINLPEIEYIESMKNYVSIHHGGKKTLVYIGITELESQLPPEDFIRVHKSFIIPFFQINALEGNRILLKDAGNAEIVLGDTYRSQFLSRIGSRTIGK